MIYTVFYYIFFASAVLFYGVGTNRAVILCDSAKNLTLPLVKMVCTVLCSAVLSWLVIVHILVPLELVDLYPLTALLIFAVISIFMETMVRIVSGAVTSEFNLSYLTVLLTLNESTDMLDVLLISASCSAAFVVLLPTLRALKDRIELVGDLEVHGNRKSLLLVSLAILILGVAVCNVSWLNPGVTR